jgi:hypothetical protein
MKILFVAVGLFFSACCSNCVNKCPKLMTVEQNRTVFEPIKMEYEIYENNKTSFN